MNHNLRILFLFGAFFSEKIANKRSIMFKFEFAEFWEQKTFIAISNRGPPVHEESLKSNYSESILR